MTKEERREAKRAQIGEAAKKIFETKGYTNTPIDEVAAAVGISVGAVYLYFKSKEELALYTLRLGAFRDLYSALAIFSETRHVVG